MVISISTLGKFPCMAISISMTTPGNHSEAMRISNSIPSEFCCLLFIHTQYGGPPRSEKFVAQVTRHLAVQAPGSPALCLWLGKEIPRENWVQLEEHLRGVWNGVF